MSSVFMVDVTCHWEPLFGSWVGMSKLSNFKPLTKFSKKVTGTAQDRHEASYSPLHGTSYYREVWRTTLQFPSVTHTFSSLSTLVSDSYDSGIWLLSLCALCLQHTDPVLFMVQSMKTAISCANELERKDFDPRLEETICIFMVVGKKS